MRLSKAIWAAPALAALLAACQADAPGEGRDVGAAAAEDYKSPSDVRYLSDAEGNVLKQVPTVVLIDVRDQLLAQGKGSQARQLEAVYDFATGEAKDPRAADRAELYLKSQLAAKTAEAAEAAVTPEAPAGEAGSKVLNPDELPAGIRITDDMVAGLRKAAGEGGAK